MPTRPSLQAEGIRRTHRKLKDGRVVWLYRVEDSLGKETSQQFVSEKEGLAWANRIRADFIRGATIGKSSVLATGIEQATLQRSRGNNPKHCDSIENLARAVSRAGITDFKDPMFATRFELWLNNLRPDWCVTPDSEKARHRFRSKARKALSQGTKHRLARVMRGMVTYAMERDPSITRDPLIGFEAPKLEKKIKPTFLVDELRRLVSDDWCLDPWWLPMCILIYTGCRAQEGMHLKWESIGWTSGTIMVRLDDAYDLKFQKERILPLQPELREILERVLKQRNLTAETARGYILNDEHLRRSGSALRPRKAKRTVDNEYTRAFRLAVLRCGIDCGGRSTHSTRHSYITLQLAASVEFYRLMSWVGHESESTTLGYGKSRDSYLNDVDGWPMHARRGMTMCLRHPPGSAFHNPEEFTDEDPVVIVGMPA